MAHDVHRSNIFSEQSHFVVVVVVVVVIIETEVLSNGDGDNFEGTI